MTMSGRLAGGWAALVALMLACGVAHAGEVDQQTKNTARELGLKGVEQYQAGDYQKALDNLQRAYAVMPVATLGLWSARALAKNGQLVEAAERYVEVTRMELEPDAAEAMQQAKRDAASELEEVQKRIPKLVVVVEGGEADSVTLDGKPLQSALVGAPVTVNPGSRTVEARRGDTTVSESVQVAEGKTHRVVLNLDVESAAAAAAPQAPSAPPPATPGPPAAAPERDQAGGSGLTTLGWVGVGVGGAALVTGSVFGLMASGKKSDLDASCVDTRCPTRVESDVDSYNQMRSISTVGFVAGGVLVAAGVTLLLVAPSDEQPVTAKLGVGPASLELRGSF